MHHRLQITGDAVQHTNNTYTLLTPFFILPLSGISSPLPALIKILRWAIRCTRSSLSCVTSCRVGCCCVSAPSRRYKLTSAPRVCPGTSSRRPGADACVRSAPVSESQARYSSVQIHSHRRICWTRMNFTFASHSCLPAAAVQCPVDCTQPDRTIRCRDLAAHCCTVRTSRAPGHQGTGHQQGNRANINDINFIYFNSPYSPN